jgi:hypothetical protein
MSETCDLLAVVAPPGPVTRRDVQVAVETAGRVPRADMRPT